MPSVASFSCLQDLQDIDEKQTGQNISSEREVTKTNPPMFLSTQSVTRVLMCFLDIDEKFLLGSRLSTGDTGTDFQRGGQNAFFKKNLLVYIGLEVINIYKYILFPGH